MKFLDDKQVAFTEPELKIMIYTCVVNDYDWLGSLSFFPHCETHLFIDMDLPSNEYLTVHKAEHDWKWYRKHSTSLFPNADWTIWHDGNVKIMRDPYSDLRNMSLPALFLAHPTYTCAYQDDKSLIGCGLPVGLGCIDKSFIIRKNCDAIKKFEENWEVYDRLEVAAWKSGLSLNRISAINTLFKINAHKYYDMEKLIIWGDNETGNTFSTVEIKL